jgi:hypothetical protein
MSDEDGIRRDDGGHTEDFLSDLASMSQGGASIYEKNLLATLLVNMGYKSYMLSLYCLCSLIGRTHEQSRTLVLDYDREKSRCIFRAEVRSKDDLNLVDDEDGDEWKNIPKDNI